tara:strand:- start:119 stop:565 length:447 start_codon:yes stop_codon:yes gene_type:complete
MRRKILRKYKDLHSDNPQNEYRGFTKEQIEFVKMKEKNNDWNSDYWLREQYNRNRGYKDQIPTQEDFIEYNRKKNRENEMVEHPNHYGGEENPYEAIKVIEEWSLGFNLGNTIKYISRAGKKNNTIEDLEKAEWYIKREINNLKKLKK